MCFIPLGSTLRAMSDTFKVISPIDQPHVSKNHLCFEFRNLTCVYMAYSNIELHSGYPPLAPLRSVVEKVHIGVLVGFFNKEGFSDIPIHCEFDPFPHRLRCKLCLTVGMDEGVVLVQRIMLPSVPHILLVFTYSLMVAEATGANVLSNLPPLAIQTFHLINNSRVWAMFSFFYPAIGIIKGTTIVASEAHWLREALAHKLPSHLYQLCSPTLSSQFTRHHSPEIFHQATVWCGLHF